MPLQAGFAELSAAAAACGLMLSCSRRVLQVRTGQRHTGRCRRDGMCPGERPCCGSSAEQRHGDVCPVTGQQGTRHRAERAGGIGHSTVRDTDRTSAVKQCPWAAVPPPLSSAAKASTPFPPKLEGSPERSFSSLGSCILPKQQCSQVLKYYKARLFPLLTCFSPNLCCAVILLSICKKPRPLGVFCCDICMMCSPGAEA